MKQLEIWSAGDARRFGVSVVIEGKSLAVWYGVFGKFDRDADGSALGGACAAVSKAVWIGRKVAEGMGVPLRVSVMYSGYVPVEFSRKQGYAAKRARVELYLKQVEVERNPAVRLVTEVTGFQKYDLARAARAVQGHRYIGSDR